MIIDFLEIKYFLNPSISHAALPGFRSKHFNATVVLLLFLSVEPTRNLTTRIVQSL